MHGYEFQHAVENIFWNTHSAPSRSMYSYDVKSGIAKIDVVKSYCLPGC